MSIDEKIRKAEEKLAVLKAKKENAKGEETLSKFTSSINVENDQQKFLEYFGGKLLTKKYGSNTIFLCKPEGFEKIGSGKDSDYLIYGRSIEIVDNRDAWDELDINRVDIKIHITDNDSLFQLPAKTVRTVRSLITGFLSIYKFSEEITSFSDPKILKIIENHLIRIDEKKY